MRAFCAIVLFLALSGPARAAIRYVNVANPTPSPPYNTWAKAATNIQTAIDAATSGDQILVTNGIYQAGSRVINGEANRVAITKPLTVNSVNGAASTFIYGGSSLRCAYITNGAVFMGFTLTNASGLNSGGGAVCESSGVVTDCIIIGNSVGGSGGGVSGGKVVNSIISSNSSTFGGAVDSAIVDRCTLIGNSASQSGGAGYNCTFSNSTLFANSAANFKGGGADTCTLYSSVLSNNYAGQWGGNAAASTLDGCTLTGGTAFTGGGAKDCTLRNCTIYGNTGYLGQGGGAYSSTLTNCLLTGNVAHSYGGGANACIIINSIISSNWAPYGGGVIGSTVTNSSFLYNMGGGIYVGEGGAAHSSSLYNCLVAGNSSLRNGGGGVQCTFVNCTIATNSAGGSGGGGDTSQFTNCIVYYNTAASDSNFSGSNSLIFCCTTPFPTNGPGNITNAPVFVNQAAGNFHLSLVSPCINSGNNALAPQGPDLDGNPRIAFGTVDMGAYELQQILPYVHTSPAINMKSNIATFGGFAMANGQPTTTWFEWGEGASFTNSSPPIAIGSGFSVMRRSVTVSNLFGGRIYQYRIGASNVVGVAYGQTRSFATSTRLRVWGLNDYGETNLPPNLANVMAADGGFNFTAAVTDGGKVSAWGDNYWGQTNVPAGLSNVVAISAGDVHVLALKADGRVTAWGDNSYGATNVPPGLSNVVAISAKGNHSLALKADGSMVAWGRNEWGQCNVPPGLSNIVAIACGRYHTVACTAEGKVFTWGRNFEGQLTIPDNLNHLMDIASGDYHGLGLNPDTTLIGWGYNEFGATNIPIGLSNVVGFDGGDFHSLALGTDGTVIAWGYNNYGESTVPPGLTNVVSIIGGFNNSLALVADIGPQAFPVNAGGVAGQDLIVPLSGSDPQGDPLSFRITALPAQASLYQYANGTRGGAILSPNTPVSDPVGRVIFVGSPNESLAAFSYVANDGLLDSPPALVTVRVRIPGAPFVATEPTTRLATNSVLLNGMITPNGLATTAWFEWGTNSAFGQTTTPQSLGAALAVTSFNSAVGPFAPDKVFHYRVVASNSAGIRFAGEQTFTAGGKLTVWGNNGGGQTNIPAGLGRVVAVGGGTWHSLALRTDGVVVGWGGSTFGVNPLPPSGVSNLITIAAGSDHGLGLRDDGTVTAWGYNGYGQTDVPAGLSNVVAIAGGGNHSVALKADGSLLTWGWNNVGQSTIPGDLTNVVAISAGYYHNVALRDDGTVVSWGNNADGQTNVPPGLTNVIGVAAGAYHSLALLQDGTVIGWGRNSKGQLTPPPGPLNIIAIRAGNEQSMALRRDGAVVVWGDNTDNQSTIPPSADNVAVLASGSSHILAITPNHPPTANPQFVSGPPNNDLVIQLAASDLDRDALSFTAKTLPAHGALYQYAAGARGALISFPDTALTDSAGRLIFTPATGEVGSPYASFAFAAQDGITFSSNATVTISIIGPISTYTRPATEISGHGARLNGFVMPTGFPAWGSFDWGTTTSYGNSTAPISAGSGLGLSRVSAQIAGLIPGQLVHFRVVASNASQVVFGKDQQFVTGGRLTTWGDNSSGQSSLPANPSAMAAIAGGLSHSLALRTDGSLLAWGNNTSGQTNIPSGIGKAAAIAAGGFHNLALLTNGTVIAWGRNNLGQATVPAAATNVIAIAAGGQHSLALRSDGSLLAWGDNSQSQRNIPASLTNAICIAAGWYHSLALRSDGTVAAWGNNTYGQSTVPAGLTNLVWVGAGLYHSLALRADGSLVAWGQNASGQTNIPVSVTNVIATAPGGSHNLALLATGLVSGWGDNAYGQANPPASLSNIVTIAAGGTHSLALSTITNHPPIALAQTITGYVNHDLTITLSATDDDLDPLTLKITSLPLQGALYQYAAGAHGPLINTPNASVSDPTGRIIFSPAPNQIGSPYPPIQFTANDGTLDSSPATVTMNIVLPPAPQLNAASSGFTTNRAFLLNFFGASNATYTVWTSTNLLDWQLLGPAETLSPGIFRYLDTAATNSPQRFYRATAP